MEWDEHGNGKIKMNMENIQFAGFKFLMMLLVIFCLLGICCLCLFVLCANRIGASDDEASVATTTPVVGVTALPQCHSKLKRPPCVWDAAPVP